MKILDYIVGKFFFDKTIKGKISWTQYKAGTYVRIVLLDHPLAFDLVDHNLLFSKLEVMGIPTYNVRWMEVFL